MNKSLLIIFSLLILIALGGAAFYLHQGMAGAEGQQVLALSALEQTSTFGQSSTTGETTAASSPPLAVATPTTQDARQGKRQYSNKAIHFSLSYPQNLQVQEYTEQGGGFTVTFQDLEADQEVQVFVTPYSDAQITDARFKLDEASGVKNNPTAVVIDGAKGIAFFSNNPTMDDTREVWFIKGGFLYEVTTYKELDAWLQNIMQTWKFI
jgi:hypothetical protein